MAVEIYTGLASVKSFGSHAINNIKFVCAAYSIKWIGRLMRVQSQFNRLLKCAYLRLQCLQIGRDKLPTKDQRVR